MSSTPDNEVLKTGDVLLGKYRVERVIGVGGMGSVHEAWHLQFEERVAIKVLLPSLAHNEEAVMRFEREARVMFKMKSEHVCRVLDVGQHRGSPYMVMEYLDGQDLGTLLENREPLPLAQALDFALQACEGLASAHMHGIVHRDLKPENLFISRGPSGDPVIKVLDFGLSKVRADGARERKLTRREQVMGTPNYMAPEQWVASTAASAASDQWALGALIFEMLTGRPPFDGELLANICALILNEPTPSVCAVRPEAPAGLDLVLHKALEKQAASRYQHVGALAQALAAFGAPAQAVRAERAMRLMQAASPEEPDPDAPRFPPKRRTSDMASTVKRPPQGFELPPSSSAPASQPVSTLPASTQPASTQPVSTQVGSRPLAGQLHTIPIVRSAHVPHPRVGPDLLVRAGGSSASWHAMLRDHRRSRRLLSVAVVAVVLAGAIAVVAIATTRADTTPAPSRPTTEAPRAQPVTPIGVTPVASTASEVASAAPAATSAKASPSSKKVRGGRKPAPVEAPRPAASKDSPPQIFDDR
jgi:serine/threonine protein kinase